MIYRIHNCFTPDLQMYLKMKLFGFAYRKANKGLLFAPFASTEATSELGQITSNSALV